MIPDTSHIKSLSDIRDERERVQRRITYYEKEFRRKFQELPAELAAAGVNNIIPPFLRGKVTDKALSGGKFLINKLFVSEEDASSNMVTKARKSGIIPVVRTLFKMFRGR